MKSVRIISVIAILVIACAVSAPAASVFTSRTDWESQVSGVTTEDFNALAGNMYQTLTSGNVTFDVPGSPDSSALWVSPASSYNPPFDIALVGNHWNTPIRGMFDSGVAGVGADVANLAVDDLVTIAVDINGEWSQWQVAYTYPNAFFWGIVAGPGETIDGITFSPTTYWIGIDNFSYATGGLSSVPEPAAYLLLGPALVLIGFAARRRKR